MVDPFILGDKIFDKSYETQFKSVDKGDFISVITMGTYKILHRLFQLAHRLQFYL